MHGLESRARAFSVANPAVRLRVNLRVSLRAGASRALRLAAAIGAVRLACGCHGPLGAAPLVLTEVPNRSSGQAFIERGAERAGCLVARTGDENVRLSCPEGVLDLPTFAGPPTFAVRCVDERLQDAVGCAALVRKVLLASERDDARSP